MGFDRRSVTVTSLITDTAATTTLNTRSQYIRPLNFKVSTGTVSDTTVRLKLTDADGRVFYLDAADKDYATAAIYTLLATDDVTTGLGPKLTDSVGALAAADQLGPMPVVKGPIDVTLISATAGVVMTFELDYEYGNFGAITAVLPTAAGSTATKSLSLNCKYAQILGFRAQSVGTSTTQKLKIADADGKIVFLDATAQTYKDAVNTDKVLLTDPTVTGLTGVVPRASTGASWDAGITSGQLPLVRSPIDLILLESEGNDEVVTATVYYKTG